MDCCKYCIESHQTLDPKLTGCRARDRKLIINRQRDSVTNDAPDSETQNDSGKGLRAASFALCTAGAWIGQIKNILPTKQNK
jgi:hypothetical protein